MTELLQPKYINIPSEMIHANNWLCWRLQSRDGKATKVPYRPDGSPFRANHREDCVRFDKAVDAFREESNGFSGIGFLLAPPWVGVDLDKCRNPQTGDLMPWATQIVREVRSYTEASPSATGVHIYCKNAVWNCKRAKFAPGSYGGGAIEVYSRARYFTVTGAAIDWNGHFNDEPYAVASGQEGLDLLAHWMNPQPTLVSAATLTPSKPDEPAIDAARRARGGEVFRALYDHGDLSRYMGDRSRADLALCGLLARSLDRDSKRIDAAFRLSALMRAKWDQRHSADGLTYGEMTIQTAISGANSGAGRVSDGSAGANSGAGRVSDGSALASQALSRHGVANSGAGSVSDG